MQLFGKLQNEYQSLWKQIIRPPRTHYSQEALGPNKFTLEGFQVERKDFDIINMRQQHCQCSLWYPSDAIRFPCVLYLHGSTGNRTEGMEYLGKLLRNNIGLCTFDFSGCGNAEGQFVTMGYYEQQDVRQVIDQLKAIEGVDKICIWGRQMGADSALLTLAKSIDVQAVVLDSPNKNLRAYIEEQVKKSTNLPSIVVNGAVKIIANTIQQKAGFNIDNVNPYKYSGPGLHHPALFVFANELKEMTQNQKKLFQAYASPNKHHLFTSPQNTRNEQCVDACLKFIKQHLNLTSSPKTPSQKQFDFFAEPQTKHPEEKLIESPPRPKVERTERREAGQERVEEKRVERVEEKEEKSEFSLKGLWSIFSGKPAGKEEQRQEKVQDGYEETRKALAGRGVVGGRELAREQSRQQVQLHRWVYASVE